MKELESVAVKWERGRQPAPNSSRALACVPTRQSKRKIVSLGECRLGSIVPLKLLILQRRLHQGKAFGQPTLVSVTEPVLQPTV